MSEVIQVRTAKPVSAYFTATLYQLSSKSKVEVQAVGQAIEKLCRVVLMVEKITSIKYELKLDEVELKKNNEIKAKPRLVAVIEAVE
jgi:DNA-binding protein